MLTTRVALTTALALLIVAPPALADRAGDAPIRAPHMLQTDHVAFTLHGGPWQQLVGDLANTPSFGSYLVGSTGVAAACSTEADVVATAVKHGPVVSARTVRVGTSQVLQATSSGRHGAVRWWAGSTKATAASALGVQRLPARLATTGKPYLLYSVTIRNAPPAKDAAQCGLFARTVAKTIARTMHVRSGPPVAQPPFGD